MTVICCESINIDSFVTVPHFPRAGETLVTIQGEQALGGKGANQAVASARMGASTLLCAYTGGADDPQTQWILAELEHFGVDTHHVRPSQMPTGQAFIMNDPDGENSIVVTSEANTLTNPMDFAQDLTKALQNRQDHTLVLLAQGELTPEHSADLPELASTLNARFVLNLAPVTTAQKDLLAHADPLILNEFEAQELAHTLMGSHSEPSTELGIEQACTLAESLAHYSRSVIITLGAQGAVLHEHPSTRQIPSPPVENVVDTTGAGDALAGTLAAALSTGKTLVEALQYGLAAGTLATQSTGAAISYAHVSDIEDLVGTQRAQEDS